MSSPRTLISAVAVLLLVAGSSRADSPAWLSPGPAVHEGPQSDAETPADKRVHLQDVFPGAGHSLLLASSSSADSQHGAVMTGCAENCQSPTWVQFTPYFWATQVRGNLTVEGLTAPLNIDLSDLWDLLEAGEVRGALMGHMEFGRDNWSVFINGDIISMAPSAKVRQANLDTGLTTTLLELGGAADIFNANQNDPVNSPLRVQVLGGARYYALDASAILSLPNVNPVVDIDQAEQWVDLFVGGRVVARFSSGVGAFLRADIGGFGIGSGSDHAWNVVSGLTMDSICGSRLILGYRVFDIDQSLYGGTGSPQGFGIDAVIHGPVMGLSFQF